MKNIILLVLFVLLTINSAFSADPDQKVRAFMRIEDTMAGIKLHLSDKHQSIPAVGLNESVKSQLANLKVGDEVMVEGRILQELHNSGDLQTLKSYLIIDSIHPVSLSQLGYVDNNDQPQDNKIYSNVANYSPARIPVSAELATAMTMTTSMLLLENLSSGPSTDPEGRRQVRQAVLLSTGLMASIVFLYEQIKSGKN